MDNNNQTPLLLDKAEDGDMQDLLSIGLFRSSNGPRQSYRTTDAAQELYEQIKAEGNQ